MNSDEMFNWPDGDVILSATHGNDSRDFRVHKSFLSFSSPIFKDMFTIPQPPSTDLNPVDVVAVADPPQALELILRFMYPSRASPVVNDLTVLSEALVLADKYDIDVARSRLGSSLMGFVTTEPLRVYAIAYRFGLKDVMKIASSHTTSIHLPSLGDLPEEFKLIPATEYHRLILLHSRYREEVNAIARCTHFPWPPPNPEDSSPATEQEMKRMRKEVREMKKEKGKAAKDHFWDRIKEGAMLNHEALVLALKEDKSVADAVSEADIRSYVSSILSRADALRLTV